MHKITWTCRWTKIEGLVLLLTAVFEQINWTIKFYDQIFNVTILSDCTFMKTWCHDWSLKQIFLLKFPKYLATFWDVFKKVICWATFGKKLGYFLFQNLVTLQINHFIEIIILGQGPWSSGHGPKVVVSNPGNIYWMDIFSHIFSVKIVMIFVWKRPKINYKRIGLFLKI